MPEIFLVASLVGLAFALNARHALHGPLTTVPAFFASWLVGELAAVLVPIHLAGVATFVALGGADAWPGWVALAVSTAIAALLWNLVRESHDSHGVLDEALTSAIGVRAAEEPLGWKEWAFPFRLWTKRVRRVRDVPYAEPGTRRYRLDIWYARDDRTARPCFLYVPGGAWTVGISNKNQQGKPLLIEMASQGWVCFAMNYPVSPRAAFPAHIVAVKRAIAWIRAHAEEYGGDPRFLMIGGNSAGGHLSSLAALTPNEPEYQPGFEDANTSVQACVPLYGVYDFTGTMLDDLPRSRRRHKRGMLRLLERSIVKARIARDPEPFRRASPWHRVGAHAPPFFVIHGSMDTLALVEEARAFVERLRAVSPEPVVYAELPRAQHAFDQFLSIRSLHAVRAIARFGTWAWERSAVSAARDATPRARDVRSPTSRP